MSPRKEKAFHSQISTSCVHAYICPVQAGETDSWFLHGTVMCTFKYCTMLSNTTLVLHFNWTHQGFSTQYQIQLCFICSLAPLHSISVEIVEDRAWCWLPMIVPWQIMASGMTRHHLFEWQAHVSGFSDSMHKSACNNNNNILWTDK